jgi:membrane protease YdiL (CAAX protease family)
MRTPPSGARLNGLVAWLSGEVEACSASLTALRPPSPTTSIRAACICSLLAIVWGNAIVIAGREIGHDRLFTGVGVPLLGVIGIAALRSRSASWGDLGLCRPTRVADPWPRRLLGAGAALLVAASAARLVIGDDDNRLDLLRLLIGTAFGEELVHRGVLLLVWSQTPASARTIVLANMATFGLWHVIGASKPDGFAVLEVVGPTVGALLFLWARLRFRSLVAPVAAHGATNVLDFG